jgi:hypothetical protein
VYVHLLFTATQIVKHGSCELHTVWLGHLPCLVPLHCLDETMSGCHPAPLVFYRWSSAFPEDQVLERSSNQIEK